MPHIEIERLKQLPRRTGVTWQGGFVRLPAWVTGDGQPYRPTVPLWVSVQDDVCFPYSPDSDPSRDPQAALNHLVNSACDDKLAGYRPARIEVNDQALADFMAPRLAEAEVEVVHRPNLLYVKRVMQFIEQEMAKAQNARHVPGCLEVPGISVERMRAFALAAERFYRAAPWQRLLDEDLIHVESDSPETGLRYTVVLGAGGQSYGLGFYDSPDSHIAMRQSADPADFFDHLHYDVWSVNFDPIMDMPLGDSDLWLDEALPAAGPNAYPSAICYARKRRIKRPTPVVLDYLEALLLALADTTEDEMDRGRWEKRVTSFDGERVVKLALPDLLHPPSAKELFKQGIMPDPRVMERANAQLERFLQDQPTQDLKKLNKIIRQKFVGKTPDQMPGQGQTPLEKAQDLCYEAFEARGRRQLQLARQALQLCPDCADAYVILAERTSDLSGARQFYEQAIAASRRALGEEIFEQDVGYFWGIMRTRPYMRAMLGLAQTLAEEGEHDVAIQHYQELLRLNPNDNQGVRDLLLPLLLENRRMDAAERLIKQYKDDPTAVWQYSRALLAFQKHGDKANARKQLAKAVQSNPHVPAFLIDPDEIPLHHPPHYSLGSREEAIMCAELLGDAWEAADGAIEWLTDQIEEKRT